LLAPTLAALLCPDSIHSPDIRQPFCPDSIHSPDIRQPLSPDSIHSPDIRQPFSPDSTHSTLDTFAGIRQNETRIRHIRTSNSPFRRIWGEWPLLSFFGNFWGGAKSPHMEDLEAVKNPRKGHILHSSITSKRVKMLQTFIHTHPHNLTTPGVPCVATLRMKLSLFS
jgi:hypothetical protein